MSDVNKTLHALDFEEIRRPQFRRSIVRKSENRTVCYLGTPVNDIHAKRKAEKEMFGNGFMTVP